MQPLSGPKRAGPGPKTNGTNRTNGKVRQEANAVAAASPPEPNLDLKWIWHDTAKASEGARLKKEFELKRSSVKSAVLRVTCDNGAEVFLNDTLVLSNADWVRPSKADVTAHLRDGKNELRIEAKNKGGVAGFVGWLTLTMTDSSQHSIVTDKTWVAAPPTSDQWKAAKEVASYGDRPWGNVFSLSSIDKQKVEIKRPKP